LGIDKTARASRAAQKIWLIKIWLINVHVGSFAIGPPDQRRVPVMQPTKFDPVINLKTAPKQ